MVVYWVSIGTQLVPLASAHTSKWHTHSISPLRRLLVLPTAAWDFFPHPLGEPWGQGILERAAKGAGQQVPMLLLCSVTGKPRTQRWFRRKGQKVFETTAAWTSVLAAVGGH